MRSITLVTATSTIPVLISEEDFDTLQDTLVEQCEQLNIPSCSLIRVEIGTEEVEEGSV